MSAGVVGIDLGTTNSLVGTVREGTVKLFEDARGEALMPSVVGTDTQGALLVGRPARNQRMVDPRGTVVSVKRKMGRSESVRVGEREMSPVQVSALILGALLDRAEAQMGTRPASAVITVPAYFDDAQRQATRDAGALAGLNIERLVNEPTAAALTYQTGVEERVLVFDLGGGTFDVSVLERDEGFLEVKASRGDTQLGGDDIDEALLQFVLGRMGSERARIEESLVASIRLKEAVERAKIALSTRTSVQLFDPFLAGTGADAIHLDLELTREELEEVGRPFIARTLPHLDAALADAKSSASKLDRVLLVGGMSKAPLVARMVAEHLQRPVQVDLDADRAVALGAAMLAGRAAGETLNEVLVDITPHTLAVGAATPELYEMGFPPSPDRLIAVPVISRDTVVPVERHRTTYTMSEDQPVIEMPIVQGEGETVGDNTFLGLLRVEDLPPSPASSPVEITFRLDLSGVLHVSAEHVPSGRASSVTITDSPYRLSAQRREKAKLEVEALRASAQNGDGARETELQLARAMVARAERALERKEGNAVARAKAEGALTEVLVALETRSPALEAKTDALSDALLDLL